MAVTIKDVAALAGVSPSTVSRTIKKLKDAGYIKAKGKSLSCTDLGKILVETFPARELFDLEYTGRLEKTLSDIERKKFTKDDFLAMIEQFVIESVDKIKNDKVFGGPVTLEQPNALAVSTTGAPHSGQIPAGSVRKPIKS